MSSPSGCLSVPEPWECLSCLGSCSSGSLPSLPAWSCSSSGRSGRGARSGRSRELAFGRGAATIRGCTHPEPRGWGIREVLLRRDTTTMIRGGTLPTRSWWPRRFITLRPRRAPMCRVPIAAAHLIRARRIPAAQAVATPAAAPAVPVGIDGTRGSRCAGWVSWQAQTHDD